MACAGPAGAGTGPGPGSGPGPACERALPGSHSLSLSMCALPHSGQGLPVQDLTACTERSFAGCEVLDRAPHNRARNPTYSSAHCPLLLVRTCQGCLPSGGPAPSAPACAAIACVSPLAARHAVDIGGDWTLQQRVVSLLEDVVWTSLMTPKRQKAVRRLVNLVHDTWRTRALESKSPSFLGSRMMDCERG